jgi:3-phenylpropionate/trans-cinnamate dioxygenase ferredoxin subunit
MQARNLVWYRVADREEEITLATNGIAQMEVEGRRFCMARYEGRWHAFAWKCPHAGGLFSEGHIDGAGNVVCPVHRYRFRLSNGWNSSGEGFKLRTYAVESREDGIYVGFPQELPGL